MTLSRGSLDDARLTTAYAHALHAGEDGLGAHMDGRSVVPLLVDPQHPSVLPATRRHIGRALRLEDVDDRWV